MIKRMLNLKNIVYSIAAISFVLCCLCQVYDRMNSIYTVNVIAETVFFIIFFKYRKTKEWSVLLFWLSFLLAAVAIYFYNNIAYGEITTILKLLGYFMLFSYIYSEQKNVQIKRIDFLVYGVIFIINMYAVYEVVGMISTFITTKYMVVLYSFYGLVLILLFMSAFRYRLLYDSRSKYVLLLTTFLTAAELLGIIAYFMNYEYLYYLENFFYLFGLGYGVIGFISENEKDSVHQMIKSGNI